MLFCFPPLWIRQDTIHRTNFHALRYFKVTHALGTAVGIDDIKFRSLANRLIGTFGLAHIAINAFVRNVQCHTEFSKQAYLPSFCASALATSGCTNWETSPPSVATSRTKLEEINENCSAGVRKIDSSVGSRCRFILAS